MSEITDLQNAPDAAAPSEQQPEDKSLTLSDPLHVSKASVGLVLQEAVNLGEINPAMARRFGERIDQIFTSLMRGAGIQWDQSNGSLKIIWPEVKNPFLEAAAARKRERELAASTAIPESAGVEKAE